MQLFEAHPLFPAVSGGGGAGGGGGGGGGSGGAGVSSQVLDATVAELAEQMKGSVSVVLGSLEDVQAVLEVVDKSQGRGHGSFLDDVDVIGEEKHPSSHGE
jgi:hypothetical protein